ncbi:hypothetical protein OAL68_01750 [Candidatus Pelagibacter sp.]|nr:hypothetical protein [Candidatus Pelagibacter sp.]|tara:strand:+ start:382 stop:1332 length:951 start_codon:yes stop_codon:yes gene_type:complete
MDRYKILLNSKSKNYLVTIGIGKKYYDRWLKYAYPSWKEYCLNNSLGLMIICNNLIDVSHPKWKKATWQKMLIGELIIKDKLPINNVCYIDTDFLINPNSPNVFKEIKKDRISVVSTTKRLPYDLDYIRRKISFNRKTYIDKKYPLDSALFMNEKKYYNFHGFKEQKDIVNMGFIGFNVKNHWKRMLGWFNKYDRETFGLTEDGDNPYISYEMLNYGKLKWLDYKYQVCWTYEMAFKYAFLYNNISNKFLIKECILDSLKDCYFLHFAGTWNESEMWLSNVTKLSKKELKLNQRFFDYLNIKISGKAIGRITPKNN